VTGGTDPTAPDRVTPDPSLPPVAEDPKKKNVTLRITAADTTAIRGTPLHVEGLARVGARPLADHRVTIYLAPSDATPSGEHGHGYVVLGTATTGADGAFQADVTVPDVTLATYDLILTSDEDAYYNAARSE
jgi:hypothetical protein